jgi:hypothetical protein
MIFFFLFLYGKLIINLTGQILQICHPFFPIFPAFKNMPVHDGAFINNRWHIFPGAPYG